MEFSQYSEKEWKKVMTKIKDFNNIQIDIYERIDSIEKEALKSEDPQKYVMQQIAKEELIQKSNAAKSKVEFLIARASRFIFKSNLLLSKDDQLDLLLKKYEINE